MLRNILKVFDSNGNGEISLSEFRGIINFFVLAMSTSLFNYVMKKLNIDVSSNKLCYKQFLEDICQFRNQSTSVRKSEKLSMCAPIVQRIKNCVLNPKAQLHSVFTKINSDEEWQITRSELKKALETGLDFKLTDEEFKELMTLLDPGNTNIIKCADFVHLFEDSCDRTCIEKEDLDSKLTKEDNVEKYKHLKGKKLLSKLKHHLNKNIRDIEKTILICDSDQSGFILPEKLKDILSVFCFPLSDEQFEIVISDVRKYRNMINYHEFFTLFKKSSDEDTKKWLSVVDKLVNFKSKCSPEMLVCEVEEMMKDCIRSRKTALLKDFNTLDVCNVGVVSKDDFRNILSKFVCRMTDKQFEALWETFPRNQYDQLLYDNFLQAYSSHTKQPVDTDAGTKHVKEQENNKADEIKQQEEKKVLGGQKRLSENRKTTKEIFYSQAPHLKSLFESMELVMVRNFRTIRYHLRRADLKNTDMVDFVTLKNILAKSGISFSSEEEFRILEYFDTRLTGKINYRDFLKIFVWYS